MLDVNGQSIGDGTLELVKFAETASAVNEITITNAATTAAPEISATGDDTDIDLKLTPKGAGNLILDGIEFPNADGTVDQVLQTNGSGVLSFGTISSYTDTDALDLFNASGSAPVFACRAWVNFNGTGTVAIRASGNVTSITDNGTGDYTVNFTTAMPDTNYCYTGSGLYDDSGNDGNRTTLGPRRVAGSVATGSIRVVIGFTQNTTTNDTIQTTVAIFR
jgi:hypothetical protein